MLDLHAQELRTFLPARDFALSKAFYTALGCALEWSDDDLALFRLGGARFYLQRYYVKDWADNCMLHVGVQDAAQCHADVAQLIGTGRFPGARVAAPKHEPYGACVTYVWDPSGVLLHLAQWNRA
jgi:hypothetical protein